MFIYMLKSNFGSGKVEAGSDEVGRGPLAGPVVAAAVILPYDYKNPEAKRFEKTEPKVMEELEQEIIHDAIGYKIAECSPEEIDKINILERFFLSDAQKY